MDTLIAIAFAVALIAASILFHYEALRVISDLLPSRMALPRRGMLIVISGVFVAHLFAISLYAAVFYLLHAHFPSGPSTASSAARRLTISIFRSPATRPSGSAISFRTDRSGSWPASSP